MDTVPNLSSGGCQPGFKVFCCHDTPIDPELKFTYHPAEHFKTKLNNKIVLPLQETQTKAFTLFGDVKFVFKHQGVKEETMFRVMFNTAFVPENNILEYGKFQLSPEDIRKDKDKKIDRNFTLRLYFEDYCS
jgi:hypothetical protein